MQTADFSAYQMSELALNAIDLVMLAMDFDAGAAPKQIVSDLTAYAARQMPGRDDAEHVRVARWVLENLLNVGSTDRGFRAVYGMTGDDGRYRCVATTHPARDRHARRHASSVRSACRPVSKGAACVTTMNPARRA